MFFFDHGVPLVSFPIMMSTQRVRRHNTVTMHAARQRKLTKEDVNHVVRMGGILLVGHVLLLAVYHSGYVSILPILLLWAFMIRRCWASVEREADLIFAVTDKKQKQNPPQKADS